MKKEKKTKAPKMPKEPKALKVKKEKSVKQPKERKPRNLLGIGSKIVICFLIPIAFMVLVGVIAYQKSADGMSDKFLESTEQTLEMATTYMDMTTQYIETEAVSYAFDKELIKYYNGFATDTTAIDTARNEIIAYQIANDFVKDIHFVTKEGVRLITTKDAGLFEGIFAEYYDEVLALSPSNTFNNWIDSHPALD